MPFERSIDIDSISDWNLVKLLQKMIKSKTHNNFLILIKKIFI